MPADWAAIAMPAGSAALAVTAPAAFDHSASTEPGSKHVLPLSTPIDCCTGRMLRPAGADAIQPAQLARFRATAGTAGDDRARSRG